MAKAKNKEAELIDLPCEFNNVSFGRKTVRVGVKISRNELKLAEADKNLCDRRLTLTIHANAKGDQEGQGRLEGMEEDLDLTATADVKSFGVHSEHITFGLTFNLTQIRNIAEKEGIHLNDFAGREGRVMIAEVGEIPEAEKAADADDEGDDSDAE